MSSLDSWEDECNEEHIGSLPRFFISLSSSSLVPPLDQITISSEVDYLSDASSMSSEEEYRFPTAKVQPLSPEAPRKLFGSYWEKEKSRDSFRNSLTLASAQQEQLCDMELPTETFQPHHAKHCFPETDEMDVSVATTPPQARRRIFELVTSSRNESSTNYDSPQDGRLVRTISTSSSLSSSPPSCLRRNRFAQGTFAKVDQCCSSHIDASVSFSPKVDVMIYTLPVEQWAVKGWTDFFI